MGWFASSATVTLKGEEYGLPDGEWIEIQQMLDYGQTQHLQSVGLVSLSRGGDAGDAGKVDIDMAKFEIARMEEWLVDWSARDEENKSVKVSRDAIRHLDPVMARMIIAAIDQYIEEREIEVGNSPEPEPIPVSGRELSSPSVSGADSATGN